MVAGAVPNGGNEILVGLAALFLLSVVVLAVVVFGFILAVRAGDGSQRALTAWAVVLAVEGMAWGATARFVLQHNAAWALIIVPTVVALQVSLFLLVRRSVL